MTKNPKNREHYWLVAFIDRAIVMAEKESFLLQNLIP
jgi:hypothetical protein